MTKIFAWVVVAYGVPFFVLGALYQVASEAFKDGGRVVRMWGQKL